MVELIEQDAQGVGGELGLHAGALAIQALGLVARCGTARSMGC
jgi:hypothetical protein